MSISKGTKTSSIETPGSKRRPVGGAYGVIHRLHTVAGVFVAPLLVIAALSGFLYAFAPSLENIVYRDVLTARSEEPARPLSEQVAAAQAVHPDLELSAVQVSEDGAATTRVLFNDPELKSSSYRQAVFVDPGSLDITGDVVQYGSSRALPLRTWISEGHRQLWLGEPGRIYSETAASWLGILSLAGVWLWWARKKHNKRPTSARARARNLHSALGVWLLPGFLFLTVTGLTWSSLAGANISNLRAELDWVQPTPSTDLASTASTAPSSSAEHSEHSHHGHDTSAASSASMLTAQDSLAQIDTVLTASHEAGMSGIIELTVPATENPEENQAWLVTEMREAWKLKNDAIAVDGTTGEIVDRVNHDDWPLAAKLSAWLIQLHMGTLFGWINQVILGAIALGLLAVVVLGYRMWWLRGRGNVPRRLPAAGQWRKTKPTVVIGLIVFLVAYTLMAPLFGISLVLFLVVDALVRAVRTRRSRTRVALTY
ncbi:hypothetical protein CDES_00930 [Corynebacterium deserti GIMN1.010]|uniref:Iron-regulated membrane protein n=1 Tax=Corynebacterium deserti GIMN1.010 TaxID=931089 RepID=A0A0M4CC29_9CORY|nr:PepSY domain-containing protein [Corynebacterium deserti]ALC04666.1 hypothetical protein CDES_00930 [Corynebacterium deserti GIMN1.010]